jgi:hypothetical protein
LTKNCANNDERQESLLRALELCCQAAPKLPLSNICQQFTAASFYEGVIAFTNLMKGYEVRNAQVNGSEPNINQQLQHILNIALQTQDQLLHVAIYEWMLFNSLKISQSSPTNLELADLLSKYYERNGANGCYHFSSKALKAKDPITSVDLAKKTIYKRVNSR